MIFRKKNNLVQIKFLYVPNPEQVIFVHVKISLSLGIFSFGGHQSFI